MSAHNPIDPGAREHWTSRFSQPVIFIILTAIASGAYLAFTIPVAVFPATNFPRIVVGVDNGVARSLEETNETYHLLFNSYDRLNPA